MVNLLRQIEVSTANGKTTGLACKEASITEQTYYRWRREYGGLRWRIHFNTVRPHSSLGYRRPPPQSWMTKTAASCNDPKQEIVALH
jgi:hypothetical protein